MKTKLNNWKWKTESSPSPVFPSAAQEQHPLASRYHRRPLLQSDIRRPLLHSDIRRPPLLRYFAAPLLHCSASLLATSVTVLWLNRVSAPLLVSFIVCLLSYLLNCFSIFGILSLGISSLCHKFIYWFGDWMVSSESYVALLIFSIGCAFES